MALPKLEHYFSIIDTNFLALIMKKNSITRMCNDFTIERHFRLVRLGLDRACLIASMITVLNFMKENDRFHAHDNEYEKSAQIVASSRCCRRDHTRSHRSRDRAAGRGQTAACEKRALQRHVGLDQRRYQNFPLKEIGSKFVCILSHLPSL